jgi:hypothetical protein
MFGFMSKELQRVWGMGVPSNGNSPRRLPPADSALHTSPGQFRILAIIISKTDPKHTLPAGRHQSPIMICTTTRYGKWMRYRVGESQSLN